MSQLALPLQLQDHAVFESFWSAGNDALVAYLIELSGTGNSPGCWIWVHLQPEKHIFCKRFAIVPAIDLPIFRSLGSWQPGLKCLTAWRPGSSFAWTISIRSPASRNGNVRCSSCVIRPWIQAAF